jgi:hypothetical protein
MTRKDLEPGALGQTGDEKKLHWELKRGKFDWFDIQQEGKGSTERQAQEESSNEQKWKMAKGN